MVGARGNNPRSFVDLFLGWTDDMLLSDIGPEGTAQQSSQSRWSHADDAQRAVQDTVGSFAFHSADEASPWWTLDLGGDRQVTALLIENRRPPYRRPHQKIVIDTSSDGQTWTEIHRGYMSLRSDVHGIPLVIHFDGHPAFRHLRIGLPHSGTLHLKRVRVFAADTAGRHDAETSITFLATRSDGLCQRLLAMLNGQACKGRFLDWLQMADCRTCRLIWSRAQAD